MRHTGIKIFLLLLFLVMILCAIIITIFHITN